jgi:hypothetical protein
MAKSCGTKASTTEAAARRTKGTILLLAIGALGFFTGPAHPGTLDATLSASSKPGRPHCVKDQSRCFCGSRLGFPTRVTLFSVLFSIIHYLVFSLLPDQRMATVQSSTKMEHAHTTGDASPRLPQNTPTIKDRSFSGSKRRRSGASLAFHGLLPSRNLSLLRSRPRMVGCTRGADYVLALPSFDFPRCAPHV